MQTNREEKIINLINLSRALKKALHDAVVHAIIVHAQQVFLNAGAEVKLTLNRVMIIRDFCGFLKMAFRDKLKVSSPKKNPQFEFYDWPAALRLGRKN